MVLLVPDEENKERLNKYPIDDQDTDLIDDARRSDTDDISFPLLNQPVEAWMTPGTQAYEESMITEAIKGLRSQSTAFFNSPITSFLPENSNKHFATTDIVLKDCLQISFTRYNVQDPVYVFKENHVDIVGEVDTRTLLKIILFTWFLHYESNNRNDCIKRLHLFISAMVIFIISNADHKDLEMPKGILINELTKIQIDDKMVEVARKIHEKKHWTWNDLHVLLPRNTSTTPSIKINMLRWPEFRQFLAHDGEVSDIDKSCDLTFALIDMLCDKYIDGSPAIDRNGVPLNDYLNEVESLWQELAGPFDSKKKRDSPWMMTTGTFMVLTDHFPHVSFVGITRQAGDALRLMLCLDLPNAVSVWSNTYGVPIGEVTTNILLTMYIQHFRGEGLEGLLLSVRKALKLGTWGDDIRCLHVDQPLYVLIDLLLNRNWSSIPIVDDNDSFICAVTKNTVVEIFKESLKSEFLDGNPVGLDLLAPVNSIMPRDGRNSRVLRSIGTTFNDANGIVPKPEHNNAKTIRNAVEKASLSMNSISTVIESPYLVFSNDPLLGYTTRLCPNWLKLPQVVPFRNSFPTLGQRGYDLLDANSPFRQSAEGPIRIRSGSINSRGSGSFKGAPGSNSGAGPNTFDCNNTISELKAELYVPCTVTDDDISLRELITILALSDEHRCFFLDPETKKVRGLITQKEVLRAISDWVPMERNWLTRRNKRTMENNQERISSDEAGIHQIIDQGGTMNTKYNYYDNEEEQQDRSNSKSTPPLGIKELAIKNNKTYGSSCVGGLEELLHRPTSICSCKRLRKGNQSALSELKRSVPPGWLSPASDPIPFNQCHFDWEQLNAGEEDLLSKSFLTHHERMKLIERLPRLTCVSMEHVFSRIYSLSVGL